MYNHVDSVHTMIQAVQERGVVPLDYLVEQITGDLKTAHEVVTRASIVRN
ncbi:MAG TPA: hypothetical protein VGI33_01160 [Paenibacillus sp.]